MGIFAAFQGLGMSFLLLGVAAIVIGTSDQLTKVTAPYVSQHFVRLDGWVSRLSSFEQRSFGALSGFIVQATAPRTPSSSSSSSSASRRAMMDGDGSNITESKRAMAGTDTVGNDEPQVPKRTLSPAAADVAAMFKAGQSVASAVGAKMPTVNEALQVAEGLFKAANNFVQQSVAVDEKSGDMSINDEMADNITAALDQAQAVFEEMSMELRRPEDATAREEDVEYDIPSIEELETMTDYKSPKVILPVSAHSGDESAKSATLRRRKPGSESAKSTDNDDDN
jgi:hypothetical protein